MASVFRKIERGMIRELSALAKVAKVARVPRYKRTDRHNTMKLRALLVGLGGEPWGASRGAARGPTVAERKRRNRRARANVVARDPELSARAARTMRRASARLRAKLAARALAGRA